MFEPLQMLSSKDLNFMGYTYKNFEIVHDHEVPQIGIVLLLFAFINYDIYETIYILFTSFKYIPFRNI